MPQPSICASVVDLDLKQQASQREALKVPPVGRYTHPSQPPPHHLPVQESLVLDLCKKDRGTSLMTDQKGQLFAQRRFLQIKARHLKIEPFYEL